MEVRAREPDDRLHLVDSWVAKNDHMMANPALAARLAEPAAPCEPDNVLAGVLFTSASLAWRRRTSPAG